MRVLFVNERMTTFYDDYEEKITSPKSNLRSSIIKTVLDIDTSMYTKVKKLQIHMAQTVSKRTMNKQ